MNITASTMPVTTVANPANSATHRTHRLRLSVSSIEVNPLRRAGSPVVLGALEADVKTATGTRPEREAGDQQPEPNNREAKHGKRMGWPAGERRACGRRAGDLSGLRLARTAAATSIATATTSAVTAAWAGWGGGAGCRATEWRGNAGNRQAGSGRAARGRYAEGV